MVVDCQGRLVFAMVYQWVNWVHRLVRREPVACSTEENGYLASRADMLQLVLLTFWKTSRQTSGLLPFPSRFRTTATLRLPSLDFTHHRRRRRGILFFELKREPDLKTTVRTQRQNLQLGTCQAPDTLDDRWEPLDDASDTSTYSNGEPLLRVKSANPLHRMICIFQRRRVRNRKFAQWNVALSSIRHTITFASSRFVPVSWRRVPARRRTHCRLHPLCED